MTSGKSFLTREIIKHLYDKTFSSKRYDKTEIIFISKSKESSEELSNICKEKNFDFCWWKLIHSFDYLFKRQTLNNHVIIIFEDMSSIVNGLHSKQNANMTEFLFRSRHYNISLIYILHGISHSMNRKSSFERVFLDNCSGLIIFRPSNNKKIIYNYLKNLLSSDTVGQLDEIFELSSKILSHPYIFIQVNKQFTDDVSKIRIDIFGENIFLQSGVGN